MIRAQPGDAAAGALELSPGQWLRVPEGIEAVLELPEAGRDKAATLTADPGSEVQFFADGQVVDGSPDSEPSPGPNDVAEDSGQSSVLHLRLGRLRVTVLKGGSR